MFEELTIKQYDEMLASKEPTPGGGSALAMIAAKACALAEMSINVTLSKHNYTQSLPVEKLVDLHAYRIQLYDYANQDAEAFRAIIAALRLPKETDEQKLHRKEHLETAYCNAAKVPIKVMETCNKALTVCKEALPLLNKYVVSDCVIGIELLKTAAKNSALNVYANTLLMANQSAKQQLEEICKQLLKTIEM